MKPILPAFIIISTVLTKNIASCKGEEKIDINKELNQDLQELSANFEIKPDSILSSDFDLNSFPESELLSFYKNLNENYKSLRLQKFIDEWNRMGMKKELEKLKKDIDDLVKKYPKKENISKKFKENAEEKYECFKKKTYSAIIKELTGHFIKPKSNEIKNEEWKEISGEINKCLAGTKYSYSSIRKYLYRKYVLLPIFKGIDLLEINKKKLEKLNTTEEKIKNKMKRMVLLLFYYGFGKYEMNIGPELFFEKIYGIFSYRELRNAISKLDIEDEKGKKNKDRKGNDKGLYFDGFNDEEFALGKEIVKKDGIIQGFSVRNKMEKSKMKQILKEITGFDF